ncbi:MAG: glycosyltransferase family 2 protein [Methylococcales bacterium]|nr:glycosyltransferase family 2 protein [Methylococcales bacterium]
MTEENKAIFSLDDGYATTRRVTCLPPIIINQPEDKIQTQLFLPVTNTTKSDGGLRTKGYFKKNSIDNPLITVITVVFNGESYLEKTILSVITQSYNNIEYIIIDGGSTDNSINIISRYGNQIDYWISENDTGIYDAMNKGVKFSNQSSYLYFLNSGDYIFDSDVLIRLSKLFDGKNIVFGGIQYDTGEIVKSSLSINRYLHNTIHHQSVFYPSQIIKHIGFDSSYKIMADYKLNIQIYNTHNYRYISENSIIALCTENGLSRSNFNVAKTEINKVQYQMFGEIFGRILAKIFNIKFFIWKIVKNK